MLFIPQQPPPAIGTPRLASLCPPPQHWHAKLLPGKPPPQPSASFLRLFMVHVLRGTDDISAVTMWVSVTFLWLRESTTNKATYRRKRQFGFIFPEGQESMMAEQRHGSWSWGLRVHVLNSK